MHLNICYLYFSTCIWLLQRPTEDKTYSMTELRTQMQVEDAMENKKQRRSSKENIRRRSINP